MSETRNEAIRNGLVQYVGALMAETSREGAEATHVALADLSEVWLTFCKNENNEYDMFVAKPILRATMILLQSELQRMKPFENNGFVKEQMREYEIAIKVLNSLVESTRGSK